MAISIRPIRHGDVPGCLIVAAEAWGKRTSQAGQPDFYEAFSSSAWRPFFYVAEEDGKIVGTACHGVSWLCWGVYNLSWIAVLKDFRGRGIGISLVEKCLHDLRPIADVIMLTTAIPKFYERWGFASKFKISTAENAGDHVMALQL